MKKLILALVIIAALALGACSAGVPQTDADAGSEPAADAGSALVAGQFTEDDLIFVFGGKQFRLNSDAALLIAALGSEYGVTTADSCVYDGEDKQFDFENLSIYTYPIEGKDMIDEVYVFGGDYTTSKGIGLGSTLDEVKAQYGDGEQVGSEYVYALSGDAKDVKSPKLTFELEDDVVVGISFYAASNVAEQ